MSYIKIDKNKLETLEALKKEYEKDRSEVLKEIRRNNSDTAEGKEKAGYLNNQLKFLVTRIDQLEKDIMKIKTGGK